LVALIFYSIPLIGIVKWPFVIISALLGAALAFLPLEERPLERWIFAFFRAIYSPTEFFWQKTRTPMQFYQAEPQVAEPVGPQTEALKQYFSSAGQKTGSAGKLEGAEAGFFSKLTGIVSGLVVQATGGPISPASTQTVNSSQLVNKQISESANKQIPATPHIEAKQIQIPQAVPIKVEHQAPSHLVVEEKSQNQFAMSTSEVSPTLAGNEIVSTKQAIFSVDAAPPNPPTTPNVVVGQVVDSERRIIEGAIMEIRDSAGRAIRAIRSNKAGHFVTVTPLDTGRYDIITDKEGYEFTPVSFDANGQIIPPILVQGRMMLAVGTPMKPIPIQSNSSSAGHMTSPNFQ